MKVSRFSHNLSSKIPKTSIFKYNIKETVTLPHQMDDIGRWQSTTNVQISYYEHRVKN